MPFDQTFSSLSAEEFIGRVLVQSLGVSHVVIGYDFFFGSGRKGTPDLMWRAGEELRFGVSVLAPIAHDGEVVSSSALRLKLAQGDVKGAAEDLGRNWRVAGTVVGGAQRGTGLGFPTANVPMPRGTSLGHGIYAVRAHVDGAAHEAAAYLGTRPTFDDGKPVLEVFLFDFDGDLYGRDIEVEFVDRIREDRKFDTPRRPRRADAGRRRPRPRHSHLRSPGLISSAALEKHLHALNMSPPLDGEGLGVG